MVLSLASLLGVAGCGSGSSTDQGNQRGGTDAGKETATGDAPKDTGAKDTGAIDVGGTDGSIKDTGSADAPPIDVVVDVAGNDLGVDSHPDGGGDGAVDNASPSGCTVASDCPGIDTECSKRTCVQGTCGVATLAPGLPVPLQIAGDCKVRQCDAQAQVVAVADNFDLPQDGNACTVDVCTAGEPSHTSAPVGQACGGANKCNANGQCVGCNVPADCPGNDTACQTRTCVQNVCGFNRVAAGTAIASQTAGDCMVVQCDGQGNTTTVNDNNDKPVDGNACTNDVCSAGTPSNPPVASGTTCGNGRQCDGAGRCAQCNVASDCGASNDCRTYSCSAQGVCSVNFAASGTVLTPQPAHNCKKAECDGQGNIMQVNDDTNLPDDGNLCTTDVCTNGTPSNPAEPTTTACGTNQHCDGAGQCAGCAVPSDCGTNPCLIYSCSNNACGSSAAAQGTVVAGQTPNDCKQKQCDGNGSVINVNFDSDTPVDDGNVCTVEGCSNGAGTSTPAPTTTACSTNGGTHCNGAGMCVAPPPPPPQTFAVLRLDVTGVAAKAAAPVIVETRSTVDGSIVGTPVALPTMANPGTNQPVMLSSSSTSEGGLSLSTDGHYLMVGGYGPTNATDAGTVVSKAAPRVVARINAAGTVETYTLASAAFAGDNFRGVVSTNGSDLWASGNASAKTGAGVWYAKFGTNSGIQVIGSGVPSGTPTQARLCDLSASILYCTSSVTDYSGVFSVGNSPPPTTPMQLANLLPGFPGGKVLSPFAFVFTDANTIYLADDRAAPDGGVLKWTYSSNTSTWTLAATFNTGTTFGARGLAAYASAGNVVLLASTADADASGNALPNSIVKFVDTGTGTPTVTTLVSPAANVIFKGLALPPN
ncbi:MAG TPA: hypothetical protein VGL59_13090 [Polyangia bacterium]